MAIQSIEDLFKRIIEARKKTEIDIILKELGDLLSDLQANRRVPLDVDVKICDQFDHSWLFSI